MIHCAIIGFQINEGACAASGNHRLCRVCRGQEKERADHSGERRGGPLNMLGVNPGPDRNERGRLGSRPLGGVGMDAGSAAPRSCI